MQPKCQIWKINSISTKTDEYVHPSFIYFSPTLFLPKDKAENLVDLTIPLSSPSISNSQHSLTFSKHLTFTILVNHHMKSQESSFMNTQDLWKHKSQPRNEVNPKVRKSIPNILIFLLSLNRKTKSRLWLLLSLYSLNQNS